MRRASQAHILPILHRLLPDGRIKGSQYFARNPKRNDKSLGSFSVNFKTGQWADFATNDKGGDLISLCAYLHDLSQKESAQRIAQMVGI
ncbi:hypothetical protein FAI40_03015 [Acetobacteraceae bacterium]|nr:hypothetical protein FAI40_03015 [Acetobacteraceae bacterium]